MSLTVHIWFIQTYDTDHCATKHNVARIIIKLLKSHNTTKSNTIGLSRFTSLTLWFSQKKLTPQTICKGILMDILTRTMWSVNDLLLWFTVGLFNPAVAPDKVYTKVIIYTLNQSSREQKSNLWYRGLHCTVVKYG